jgi:hypothetical protein
MPSPLVKTIPLDTPLALETLQIPRDVAIYSVFFNRIPAGVTVQMAYNQKEPFEVSDGQSFANFGCLLTNEGISFVTSAPAPGQTMQVTFGVTGGGQQVTAG